MRCTWSIILVVVGAAMVMPNPGRAAEAQRVAGQTPTNKDSVTVDDKEKQRAAALAQTATALETQMAQRVRWVEMQLQKEEKLLAQRMAYAGKLRANGLEKNDPNVLKQAEDYERRALAAFEQRVRQYEQMLQAPNTAPQKAPANSRSAGTAPGKSRQTTPSPTRATQNPHPQSRLIRRR